MKDNFIIKDFAAGEESKQEKKFWKQAFLFYAGIEVLILVSQYAITRSKCAVCVLPPAFYIVNWFQHLLFTGLLWYCLNRIYYLPLWKVVPINIFLFAAHYFLWLAALYAIFHSGQNWLVWDKIPSRSFESFVYGSWADIGKYVVKLTAFYMLKYYFEYRKAEKQRIQLALINKEMQLNLLKQQLSPHFYFNTMNNLYGLSRSNSPRLSDALSQLSSIMHYVIVDCNQPKVLLSQEINFLSSYIELEKLRYEKNTIIEMKVEGEAREQTILPLLLIQFVENAFKHGMKEKSDRSWMKAEVLIDDNELTFRVGNSYYEISPAQGIGITSVKHILNLQYEGKYDMNIEHTDNRFSVTLKMNLS